MSRTFDFWPFSLESGSDFSAIYLLCMLAAPAIGLLVGRWVAAREVLRAAARPDIGSRSSGHPYRRSETRKFEVGTIPTGDEVTALAYLRGGERAVADLTLTTALASGWLRHRLRSASRLSLRAGAGPDEPLGSDLHRRMASLGKRTIMTKHARDLADEVARDHAPQVKAALETAGLRLSDRAVRQGRIVYTTFVAAVVALGFVRVARGVELGRPVNYLLLQIGILAVIAFPLAFLIGFKRRTAAGRRYLAWSRHATHSLVDDVHRGRRASPAEVTLATAIVGAAATVPSPLFASPFAGLWSFPARRAAKRHDASCGSDAPGGVCGGWGGASGCGSGGGCGSAGCGGGGGCGGGS